MSSILIKDLKWKIKKKEFTECLAYDCTLMEQLYHKCALLACYWYADMIGRCVKLYPHLLRILAPINPILTGGGVNLTPPCTKFATVSRPPLIATRLFMTFFFQVLRIFWYQVCENRTIGREGTQLFVLARRLKNCPKSAFCICLCT